MPCAWRYLPKRLVCKGAGEPSGALGVRRRSGPRGSPSLYLAPSRAPSSLRSASTQVYVTASVVSVTYPLAPTNAPDCGSQANDFCQINKGSMSCKMIETACTPKLEGGVVATDETGTATFDSLAIRSGPAANYLLRFDGGNGQFVDAATTVAPRVATIEPQDPQVGVSMYIEPGVPFDKQPSVLLLGWDNKPVPNAVVTIFASENLNYFQEFSEDKISRSAGTSLHHPRGQNYALLSSDVSLPSDENGIAVFTNVTLTASSSPYLYLMFYCEGAVASWNNPQLKPPNPGAVPRPERYSSPIFVTSPIKEVVALPPGGTGFESESCVEPNQDNLPPVVLDGEPLPLAPRVRLLDEDGNPVVGQHAIAVVHTSAGAILPGLARPQMWRLRSSDYGAISTPEPKHLIHSMSSASDADGVANFPDLRFGVHGQEDGSVHYLYHKLAYCTPGASGALGVYDGCAISCAMQVRSRARQITWSVQPQYLRSIAAAKAFEVALPGEPFNSAPPKAVVRFVDANGVGVPSKRPIAYLWDLDNIKLACCVIRTITQDKPQGDLDTCATEWTAEFTDEQLLGRQAPPHLPPKPLDFRPLPVVVHTQASPLRDRQAIDMMQKPCIQSYLDVMQEFVDLELVTPESQSTLSGAAGFAIAPIAYKLGSKGYLLNEVQVESGSLGFTVLLGADAKKRAENGRIRVVMTDSTHSIWSEPSAPITFSMPDGIFTNVDPAVSKFIADSAAALAATTSDPMEEKMCASLRPDGKFTLQALGLVAEEHKPTRRPDNYGGKVSGEPAFLQPCSVQRSDNFTKLLQDSWQELGLPPTQDSCVKTQIGDFTSWMLPLTMPFVYDSTDINFQLKTAGANDSLLVAKFDSVNGTLASFFARVFQAATAYSFVGCVDPADVACHETDFASFLKFVLLAKWYGVNNLFGNPQQVPFDLSDQTNSFNKIFPGKDLPLPAIRMRAVDVAGNGVPGLRVRLNVFDSIYPNMPPVARVITCSLLKGKEGDIPAESAVPIEGLTPNEVTEMRQEKQLVCETDANGYVNMRVSHPVWRFDGDPNVAEPKLTPIEVNMPEYIESSSSGTIFYEYSAYRPVYDTSKTLVKLERACSIDLQMDVKSQVASVEWADDSRLTDAAKQQRTAFNIITEEGALEEIKHHRSNISALGRTVATCGRNVSRCNVKDSVDALAAGGMASFETKEGVVTVTGATDLVAMFNNTENRFCFNVNDGKGKGVKNKMLRFDWVQLPSYLAGWTTKLPHGCYTLPKIEAGNVTAPGCLYNDPIADVVWTVKEYGLNTASAVNEARVVAFPFEPFATMAVSQTNMTGHGCAQVAMHEGHPGVYGFTMEVDGVRSSPVIFNVKSLLKTIALVQQPEDPNGVPGEDVTWYVKSTLKQPPKVRLLKADGQPLARYQVFARAVHPDTEVDLDEVLFDMADRYGTVVYNPTGAARGTPASDDGECLFPNLQLFDAKNGTRFKLKMYFRVTQAFEEKLLNDYEAKATPEVFVVTTTTMVAINPHRLTVLREPSQEVTLGSVIPQTPKMYASFELQPFQFAAPDDGKVYDLYKLPDALTQGSLVTAALLPVEFNGQALSPEQSVKFVDAFRGNKCSFFGSRLLAGNCTIIRPGNGASGEDTGVRLSSNFGDFLASSGVVVGGVVVDPQTGVFASKRSGRPPYFAMTLEFNEFAWIEGGGSGSSVRVGGTFELPGALQQPAVFRKMQVSTEPARIEFLNTVPKDITVGSSFLLEAKVFISSGMHLGSARVCAHAVSAFGLEVSPAAFLMDAFNIKGSSLGPDSAQLSEKSNCGITDANV